MGKANGRKSESWKPTIVHDSSFISKNKKRKEKRHAKSLSPSKMVGDLNELKSTTKNLKTTGKLNRSLNTPLSNKKKLSAALPTSVSSKNQMKVGKEDTNLLNSVLSSAKKNQGKLTGILSNSNTPKKKINGKVAFSDEQDPKKLIANEGKAGEEPITDKPVKLWQSMKKDKKLGVLRARRPSMIEIKKDEDEEDSGAGQSDEDLLDMEASEGEETDSNDEEDSENDSLINFKFSDDDDDNEDDDDENHDDGDDEHDNDDDDGVDDNEEEETIKNPKSQAKTVSKLLKKKQTAQKPNNNEDDVEINNEVKLKTKNTSQKKQIIKEASENEEDSDNDGSMEINKSARTQNKKLMNGASNVKQNSEVKKKESNTANKKSDVTGETSKTDKPTNFVGFIRGIPENISRGQIKAALGTKIDSKDIVKITGTVSGKKKQKCFLIYFKTDDALQSLLNTKFKVADTVITVYEARENKRVRAEKKPIAFLPRVPISVTDDSLKQSLEKEFGAGCITNLRNKNIMHKFQTRNVLAIFVNEESFTKAIKEGECNVNGNSIVIREAHEAGLKIPLYRAVLSKIPDKTDISSLKKVVEDITGKNTVTNIRSSMRKHSFAFVMLENADAQKALLTAKTLTINGAKLEVIEYIPRPKKKRDFMKRKTLSSVEETQPNKKQKVDDAESSKQNVKKPKLSKTKPADGQKPSPIKSKPLKAELADGETSSPSKSPQQKSAEKSRKKKEKAAKHFKKEAKPKAAKKGALTEKMAVKKQQLKQKKGKGGDN